MVWDLDTMKRLNAVEDFKHNRGTRNNWSECQELIRAIERGGFDLSQCMRCGELVVCIPDGQPMCEGCAGDDDAEYKV
jgi:hypothetical protein